MTTHHHGVKRPPDQRYTTLKAIDDLRHIWLNFFDGNLATICRDDLPMAGYPVSSVVPYVLDNRYCPIVYLGSIAEHTNNALANPKASIFLREHKGTGDVQAQWRLCAIGDLEPISDHDEPLLSARYFDAYPHAKAYENTHKFRFFRLTPKKYRIIMGFGDIRWIAAEAVFPTDELTNEARQRIINHMNEDHMDANRKYLRALTNLEIAHDDEVTMVAVNPYGCTLRYKETLYFQPFKEFSPDAESIKAELISIARA